MSVGRIKNKSGEDRIVPWLNNRLVMAGQIVEVPEADVFSYTCQAELWEPADTVAQSLHDQAVAELEAAQAEAEQIATEQAETAEERAARLAADKPGGNDSRDAWAAWVLNSGLATESDIADLGRNELRDTYGSTDTGAPGVPAATLAANGGDTPDTPNPDVTSHDPAPDGVGDQGQEN